MPCPSANNRLILICAGPMELCWWGIDAADDNKEQYVTVLSHSGWNDSHADTAQLTHTWSDIERDFAVRVHRINDQNPLAFHSPCNDWTWVKGLTGYGPGLYDTLCAAPSQKAGDASDAGMMWYLIAKNGAFQGATGTSNPTMSAVQAFFR